MPLSRLQQGIADEHPEWVIPKICQENAKKTGTYVAVLLGVITYPITRRLAGLDKNRSLFLALSASGVSGYVSAKYSFAHCEKLYGFHEGMKNLKNEAEKNTEVTHEQRKIH